MSLWVGFFCCVDVLSREICWREARWHGCSQEGKARGEACTLFTVRDRGRWGRLASFEARLNLKVPLKPFALKVLFCYNKRYEKISYSIKTPFNYF
jgi:hypothetical protein